MKSKSIFRVCLLVSALTLFAVPSVRFHGQTPAGQNHGGHANGLSRPNKMDAPETNSEEEQFRKSAAVQAIARTFHIKDETAAEIFEDFNSAVLILAILGFLVKTLPKMFRKRTDTLQKELSDARAATEDANARLYAVEERLGRLDSEIEAVRKQVEQESAGDEQRIKEMIEAERKRIISSAKQQIAAAQAAAQRELKRFAADLAVDRATKDLRMAPETDRELVSGFAREISERFGKGVQN